MVAILVIYSKLGAIHPRNVGERSMKAIAGIWINLKIFVYIQFVHPKRQYYYTKTGIAPISWQSWYATFFTYTSHPVSVLNIVTS